nr:hypothetical protein [Tanacetum cinerariifolium]
MAKPGLGLGCLRQETDGEDTIVYRLFPCEPVSRSTLSKLRTKQVCWRKATSRSESQNCPTEKRLCLSPSR